MLVIVFRIISKNIILGNKLGESSFIIIYKKTRKYYKNYNLKPRTPEL
jgi:hypothetical protein